MDCVEKQTLLTVCFIVLLVYAAVATTYITTRILAKPTVSQLYNYYCKHLERIGESWEDWSCQVAGWTWTQIHQRWGP